MKNRTLKTGMALIVGTAILFSTVACGKYRKYDNNEVVENTFTGNVNVTSGGQDPAGDFIGDGDSGVYSFVWENPKKTASVNFDVTTATGGSVKLTLNDAKGDEVLNQTRPEAGNDTFAGVSQEGKPGKWLVTITLTNFNGDGSYSIHPGN